MAFSCFWRGQAFDQFSVTGARRFDERAPIGRYPGILWADLIGVKFNRHVESTTACGAERPLLASLATFR
jgi:hypothetical protein